MMYSPSHNPTPPRPSRPWQYSLKTLFLITLGLAVALAIVVSFPSAIAVPVLICLAIALPAFLTMVAIYGSGYQRAFAFGALFPTCTLLYATGWLVGLTLVQGELSDLEDWLEFFEDTTPAYRVCAGSAWLLAVAIGWMAVGVRHHFERQTQSEDDER